eukprot:g5187.t1
MTALLKNESAGDSVGGTSTITDAGGASPNLLVKQYDVAGFKYQVTYWDLPGSRKYASQAVSCCLGSAAVLIVYDVTRRATFTRLPELIDAICGGGPTPIMTLVGNKVGGENKRQVTREEAAAFADDKDMDYIECDALSGLRARDPFNNTFLTVVHDIPQLPEPSSLLRKGVKLGAHILANRTFLAALYGQGTFRPK